jgi:hypothetical protein
MRKTSQPARANNLQDLGPHVTPKAHTSDLGEKRRCSKHFPEWNSVCRGRVTSVDEDHDHNTLW